MRSRKSWMSNLVLVNMADLGDDPEIYGDGLAAKRSQEDHDTSSGECHGTSGTSASTGDNVCKTAITAISLMQRGNKISDVAATFTLHATGRREQHVFEIFAMDSDDKCRHEK